jgi:hypothetical protein
MHKGNKYACIAAARLKLCFFLLPLIVVVSGCGSASYGRLESSPEITKVFKDGKVLSSYQYYVSGFQRIPYAIIAVDNNFQLRSRGWQALDLDAAALNQIVYRMDAVYSLTPRGAWIVDNEGNRLGVWYSSQYRTTVERRQDNQVLVASPEPPDLRGVP